jgi:cell division protein FtsZ
MSVNLKMPDITELKPRITVFGVGGAGCNAVNNMIEAGFRASSSSSPTRTPRRSP